MMLRVFQKVQSKHKEGGKKDLKDRKGTGKGRELALNEIARKRLERGVCVK